MARSLFWEHILSHVPVAGHRFVSIASTRSGNGDLTVKQVTLDKFAVASVRVTEAAAAGRCNAEQIALVQRELGNRWTEAAFVRRAGVDDVSTETACFATGHSFRGEFLPCATGRQSDARRDNAKLAPDTESAPMSPRSA